MYDWNIEEMTGYVPKTTFYTDLSIADGFGINAIKDTYNRVIEAWMDNVEFITEFCMALNWKSWEWSEKNREYCELYCRLWEELDNYLYDHLKGDDLTYYLRTTD